MTYSYTCTACDENWDESHLIADRDTPIQKPCPHCGVKTVKRGFKAVARISYDGKDVTSRISSGFNDLLTKVKSGSGRRNTINTK